MENDTEEQRRDRMTGLTQGYVEEFLNENDILLLAISQRQQSVGAAGEAVSLVEILYKNVVQLMEVADMQAIVDGTRKDLNRVSKKKRGKESKLEHISNPHTKKKRRRSEDGTFCDISFSSDSVDSSHFDVKTGLSSPSPKVRNIDVFPFQHVLS